MNTEITLTKLDAAKRQLETAVTLYFNDRDPVSIHTLTCAAHEILATLNKKRGNPPSIISDSLIKEPHKAEFRKWLREAMNFVKHADKDSEGVLTFYPAVNEYFLLDSCELYQILTGEKVPHFIIFRAWFNSRHPHVLKTPAGTLVSEKFGDDKVRMFSTMMTASVGFEVVNGTYKVSEVAKAVADARLRMK